MVSQPLLTVTNLSVRYAEQLALLDASLTVTRGEIVAVIGPARAGKTTLMRAINRSVESEPRARVEGDVRLAGDDLLAITPVTAARQRVGMVSPLPVALPMSVLDNVLFAAELRRRRPKAERLAWARACLERAALYDEVAGRLDSIATSLSGGQQQRLSLARSLAHEPEVLCLDEFSIAIDPMTTARIETSLRQLSRDLGILVVTNQIEQARRLADRTIMMLDGRIIDDGPTADIFSGHVRDARTLDYIEGRFG